MIKLGIALLLTISLNSWANIPYVKSLYSKPLTLDPIKMNDTASLTVGNLLYDGLLKFSETLEIIPNLVSSIKTSADGKTLTFVLKENTYFHNNEKIKAEDVLIP